MASPFCVIGAGSFASVDLLHNFVVNNLNRHLELAAMRKQGPAFVVGGKLPNGFGELYQAEATWLAEQGIAYAPSKGWHYIS